MKNSQIKSYIEIRDLISVLENESKELEAKQKAIRLKVESANEKKDSIEKSIIEDMKSANYKTYEFEGKNITRATRETLSIVDETAVMRELVGNLSITRKIKKLFGFSGQDLKDKILKVSLNRKEAKSIIEGLATVEGVKIEGTDIKKTDYLTIK